MTEQEFRGESAGIVTRSIACVLDMLVVVAMLAAVWAAWSAVLFLVQPARFTFPSPTWPLVVAVATVFSMLYLTTTWATSGRTYGAQLFGLRVVSRRSDRLGWTRAGARAAAYLLFPLGLAWTLLDTKNRSLQDLLTGTGVIYDWAPHSPQGREGARNHPAGMSDLPQPGVQDGQVGRQASEWRLA